MAFKVPFVSLLVVGLDKHSHHFLIRQHEDNGQYDECDWMSGNVLKREVDLGIGHYCTLAALEKLAKTWKGGGYNNCYPL